MQVFAEIMSQQEASGFRFDMDAAIRVRSELQEPSSTKHYLNALLLFISMYPGKVFTPKRADKKKGYVSRCAYDKTH